MKEFNVAYRLVHNHNKKNGCRSESVTTRHETNKFYQNNRKILNVGTL